jgi:hypothetical protein
MQLPLFSQPVDPLSHVLWCRPCLGSTDRFAVGLPVPLPLGMADWLRQNCAVLAVQALPSGTVAVQVAVSGSLLARFRALPSVRGGSRHESNLLLW